MVAFSHEVGFGVLDPMEVLAVRGERLVLTQIETRFRDGFLCVCALDEHVRQIQRMMTCDADDLDAAIAELDRMHAEIGD